MDPHLLHLWLTGWTQARETAPPVAFDDGWRVDVGWADQKTRFVFPGASRALTRLGTEIDEPFVYLKACLPVRELAALLPPRWVLDPQRHMLRCDGAMPGPVRALPAGYTLACDEDRANPIVRIRDDAGAPAAFGRVTLVGDHAIYDSIRTEPDHRRMGLGGIVMRTLERVMWGRGARHGFLSATAEGRALYETLGWRFYAPYASAVLLPPISNGEIGRQDRPEVPI